MPIERYYTPVSFDLNGLLEIKETEFHHMTRVMRTRHGDSVELVNGKGALAQATVQDIGKEKALLQIDSIFQEPERPVQLILAQAFPKQNRLDFILEKGTELGVDAFWLFPGHLSVKKEIYPNQIERAQAVLIAAMKQCGRLTLPEVMIQPSLDQWKGIASTIYFGDLSENAPPFKDAWANDPSQAYPIIFVTGPESGFSGEEVRLLRTCGAIGVKLHENVLRTDTASLMALSLLSHWLMR